MRAATVESLRRQLREKFPQAHGLRAVAAATERVPASLFAPEAFPAGAVSEVVVAGPVSGLGLLVAGLLGEPEHGSPHPVLVLIDGADSFDPNSFSPAACSRVLWVRCRAAVEMLNAADLLARDGNVPFLVLDATGLPRKDYQALRQASSWWRLKRIVEGNGGRLVVLAPFPMVPCARQRWQLAANLSLGDFDCPREELRQRLRATPDRLTRAN